MNDLKSTHASQRHGEGAPEPGEVDVDAREEAEDEAISARGFRGCWFVSSDGRSVEAMTEGQILIGLRRGHLTPNTLVTLDNNGPWLPIAEVSGLANAVLLSRGTSTHSSRPPRPVILEALPTTADAKAMEPRKALGFAHRARRYLSAFFAAGLLVAVCLL